MTVGVIGAGASGILAALKASEKHSVILLEANDIVGKKILVTGNGRCNYFNENISVDKYYTDNKDLLEKIISDYNQKEVLRYLKSLGIYPKIKNGYYYPFSNQAASIREIFEKELLRRGVEIFYNFKVKKIEKYNFGFAISSGKNEVRVDKLIIASGSKASPKTGSDGDSYIFASALGYQINPVLPALVQVRCNDRCFKVLNGIRCDAKVSLYVDDTLVAFDEGELQITDYGLSGICIFNISRYVSKALYQKKKAIIRVNFLPFAEDFSWFERFTEDLHKTIYDSLESILSYKITKVILERCNISQTANYKSLTQSEKENLKMYLTAFPFEVIQTNSFDKAQVCTGGVSLSEVDHNMCSLKERDIYLTGELLDVDGICGGYNLAFAFISGYLAGKDI